MPRASSTPNEQRLGAECVATTDVPRRRHDWQGPLGGCDAAGDECRRVGALCSIRLPTLIGFPRLRQVERLQRAPTRARHLRRRRRCRTPWASRCTTSLPAPPSSRARAAASTPPRMPTTASWPSTRSMWHSASRPTRLRMSCRPPRTRPAATPHTIAATVATPTLRTSTPPLGFRRCPPTAAPRTTSSAARSGPRRRPQPHRRRRRRRCNPPLPPHRRGSPTRRPRLRQPRPRRPCLRLRRICHPAGRCSRSR